jgi:predicted ATPase
VILTFGPFEVDDELFELRRDGVPIPVQKKTFDLLLYLMRAGTNVVTHEELMRDLWRDVVVSEPALRQAVLTVRKALGDDGPTPKIVKTVRGRGYRFDASVTIKSTRPERLPFVGRQSAMTHLRAALGDAVAGRGSVVLVAGEQGIGKTRLLEEFEEDLEGVRLVVGRAFAGDGAPPLWPWIQIDRRLEGDPVLFPDVETAEARFRFADRVVSRIVAQAKVAPLVVVLEDLHTADAATLDLLRLLLPETTHSRVLMLLTSRHVEGVVARVPRVSTLELGRLGREDIEALIRAVLKREPGAALVDRVLEKTGGTPSIFVHIAHILENDVPRVPGTSAMLGTSAVKNAVAQQVASLSAAVRDTLATAAVLGPTFALGPLALAGDTPAAEVLTQLDEAARERLIAHADGVYRFTQPLVRDALYRSLPEGERIKRHARVGQALIAFYGDEAERAHAGEIATHLGIAAASGDVARAVHFALAAHAEATARGDRAAAGEFIAMARKALRHAPRDAELQDRVEAAARASG